MNIYLSALIVVGIIAIVYVVAQHCANDEQQPATVHHEAVANDKIVYVKGADYNDVKKAANQFCRLYSEPKAEVVLRISKVSVNEVAVTLPYDAEVSLFCFLVNYLKYPQHISYNADVRGWFTTSANDEWMTPGICGKKVMLYLDEPDTEYDNVYLVTEDGVTSKIDFSRGPAARLPNHLLSYMPPPFNGDQLKEIPSEEIR